MGRVLVLLGENATAAPRFVEIEPDHWLSCHYPIN
jgi:hypothetical protein